MAVDKIALCNLAASQLPVDPISDLSDDALFAEWASRLYAPTLGYLLSMHDWKFSRRRAALAEVANDRPTEWAHAYDLPTEVVAELRILSADALPGGGMVPDYVPAFYGSLAAWSVLPRYWYSYLISGQRLYTNVPGAVLEFLTGATGESDFPPQFAWALALELAARTVVPVLKDPKREAALIQKAEVARDRAIADERNRDPSESTYGHFQNESELARAGFSPSLVGVIGWPDGWPYGRSR